MAEFVRIWDGNKYVEYDITVSGGSGSGGTGTTIPVTPVNISSNVNVGVINKVIDTNEIITSTSSVDISQILRPVVIEKSDANRFSIQTSIANLITIQDKRNNIVVNTSSVGRTGAKGEKGEDSIIEFKSNIIYNEGTLVIFDNKVWISQVFMDGRVTSLSSPAENEFWSQITDQKYITDLPLTSGYEVASQEEWNAIEDTVELGDIIRVSTNAVNTITLGTVDTDTSYTISDVGRALTDSSGRQYFVTGAFTDNRRLIRATNREDITVSDFEEALTLAGVVFGENPNSGLNTPLNIGAEFGQDSNNVFQITTITIGTSDSIKVGFEPIAGSGTINVGLLPTTSPTIIGNKIYSGANPGVEISEAITNLVVGNRLHVVGEESSTTQNITKIAVVGGKTYFDIADYIGYDVGDTLIGRSVSDENLVSGQWYVRNSNTENKIRLDAIGPDVVLRADVSTLQNNFPTLTTNPGLVTDDTRSRADAFFSEGDGGGGFKQTKPIPFTLSHLNTLRFLQLKETGGRYDGTFVDLTDNESQDLALNGGKAFPSTEQGAQQNFIDKVTVNSQNLQITPGIQTVVDGDDIVINTLSSNAEVNVVRSVNLFDESGADIASGLKISELGVLSLNSTNEGGTDNGEKILRLRSDGHIPTSVFGQINLSETEVFQTTTQRNDFDERIWNSGGVSIITGDPAATEPFTATFAYEGIDQTVAGVTVDSDWIEIVTPTGAVASVAGRSGVVTLGTEDIVGLVIDKDAVSKDDNADPVVLTQAGLMSISDKDKIDGIESGATIDQTAIDIRALADISVLPGTDGTAENGAREGLISGADKFKLDEIETSATADQTAIDIRALADISVLPGTDGTVANGARAGLITGADKFKLDAIETGATANQDAVSKDDDNSILTQAGLMSISDKDKIDGITTGADVTADFTGQITAGNYTVPTRDSATDGSTTSTKFLREDSVWVVPTDTTYDDAISADDTVDPAIVTQAGLLSTDDKDKLDSLVKLTDDQITDINRIDTIESNKQDTILAGTNISIGVDGKTISVENTSGVQVTVFAFGMGTADASYNLTPDGDSITIIQFTGNDPAIEIPDLIDKEWEIFDTSLDTDIWQVSGSCSVMDSDGDIINNRASCENENNSGTWTVGNNPKLQRIT